VAQLAPDRLLVRREMALVEEQVERGVRGLERGRPVGRRGSANSTPLRRWRIRSMRLWTVASVVRRARAVAGTLSPHSVRRISVSWLSALRSGWQHMKIIRSWSSRITSSPNASLTVVVRVHSPSR
jgi:hypothetical protein